MELAVIAYRFATDAQFALDMKERFQETLATLGLRLSVEEEKAVRLLLPGLQTSLASADGINMLNAEPWAI